MPNRSNEQWISDLKSDGADKEAALADLHQIILKGLPYALSNWLTPNDPLLQALAEDTAQDTLLRVLEYLDTFEGRSKFTTWVHKIAVRIALTELRRKRWEDVSLDGLVDGEDTPPAVKLMTDSAPSPEELTEGADMIARVRRIIAEELTDKQRKALVAIAIKGMPLEEVARRMGTNRNSLYKLMHDTRLRLKRRLAREGLSAGDVLAVFEKW